MAHQHHRAAQMCTTWAALELAWDGCLTKLTHRTAPSSDDAASHAWPCPGGANRKLTSWLGKAGSVACSCHDGCVEASELSCQMQMVAPQAVANTDPNAESAQATCRCGR